MIRITKQTDYGIVLLTHMAEQPERLFTALELAEEARLPAPMASKTLKNLAREGVLESHRGVKGGYCLSKPPGEITVTEIITALEGPIGITECIDDAPGECDHVAFCGLRSNWNRINLAITQALDGITLSDMTQPLVQRLVTLGSPETASRLEQAGGV